jgi:hypothetical protein
VTAPPITRKLTPVNLYARIAEDTHPRFASLYLCKGCFAAAADSVRPGIPEDMDRQLASRYAGLVCGVGARKCPFSRRAAIVGAADTGILVEEAAPTAGIADDTGP